MTEPTTPLVEIDPVKETISGYTNKLQINLAEDSSDQEILRALGEACKEWSSNLKTGTQIMQVVGRIMVAVKIRELYRREPWGTLDVFIYAEVESRFDISKRHVYNAIEVVEALPNLDEKRAKGIGSTKLISIAKAVKAAPSEKKSRMRSSLLDLAEKSPTTTDFQNALHRRQLLPTKSRERGARPYAITFQVPKVTFEMWLQICGKRNAAMVFKEMCEHEMERLKKPVRSEAGSTKRAMSA